MRDMELFVWGLLALGWILFQVIRRLMQPPRPLGRVEDEEPDEQPDWEQPAREAPPVRQGPPVREAPPVRQGPPVREAPPVRQGPPVREAPPVRPAPLDVEWGRSAGLPPAVERRPAAEHRRERGMEAFPRSREAAQAELRSARELERRQAQRRFEQAEQRRQRTRTPRPRLRNQHDLRHAVVMATVIGPCRAMEPWQPVDRQVA